jgi:phosphate-selective porin OprO and OprP
MKTRLLYAAAAVALFAPVASIAQTTPPAGEDAASSGLDTLLPADDAEANATVAAAPAPTGDPVLDRLNALEARLKVVEARNAQLEAAAADTQARVQSVEVRSFKSAQPGVVPLFSDVNDTFTFKPRGMLQVDFAAYNERRGGYEFSNGTDIRRGRFGFEGTAFKNFKWRLDAEYLKGTVSLLDAYISYAINPKLSVTAGQHKAPYGLEANTSDAVNTFLERSMGSNAFGAVAAERRIGLSFAYTTDKLNASVGIYGGSESATRNADTAAAVAVVSGAPGVSAFKFGTHNEPFSYNGRITFDPILDTGKVVHVGVSAYHASNFAGNALTISDRPNTRVDGGNIVSVALTGAGATPTAPATGVKNADYIGGEGAIVFGPFSVQGEYGRLRIDRYGTASTLHFDGYNVFGSVFLTGESRSFKGGVVDKLKPFQNFDPAKGHFGALELAARYDRLDLTDGTLPAPVNPSGNNIVSSALGGRKAETWTGAINWYLNPNFRAAFNYIRFTGYNSGLVRPTATGGAQIGTAKGDAFATRLQLDF